MDLPPTHYDIALKKHPEMIKYLRKDLTIIAEKHLQGPFESPLEYPGDRSCYHPLSLEYGCRCRSSEKHERKDETLCCTS